jgi:hypothetical protein
VATDLGEIEQLPPLEWGRGTRLAAAEWMGRSAVLKSAEIR